MRARTLVLAAGVALAVKVCSSRHRGNPNSSATVAPDTPGSTKPLVIFANTRLRRPTTDPLTRSGYDLRDRMETEVQRFAARRMGGMPLCRQLEDQILRQSSSGIELRARFECTAHYAALGGFDGRAKVEVRGSSDLQPFGIHTWVGIPILIEEPQPASSVPPAPPPDRKSGPGRTRSATIGT